MSLFERRASRGTPFGWLVIGLGNPGDKYTNTRHNVGQACIDVLAERHGGTLKGGRDNALVAEVRINPGDHRSVLAFPITFMNESGQAASALVRRYKLDAPEQIIVIHDELDLDPGVIRLKSGGGLAGHNGLRSLTQHLKTQDYLRVRIGVGKPPGSGRGASHVLNKIPKAERDLYEIAVNEAADAVEMIITDGVDTAMQRVHAPR